MALDASLRDRRRSGSLLQYNIVGLGRERLIQRKPLFGNPRTDQTDRGDDGDQKYPKQDRIFNESSAIFVFQELAEDLYSFGHVSSWEFRFNGVDAIAIESRSAICAQLSARERLGQYRIETPDSK
jgi:hypothetical protein